MFDISVIQQGSKEDIYKGIAEFSAGLFFEERDAVANMANLSSLLYNILPDVNWAGFYIFKESMLVLGPFQGKPACIRIGIGKGVCGNAAATLETQLVKDVNAFPGHIACDGDTNSEIVVPMVKEGQLIGVLDIDSPKSERFDEIDQKNIEILVDHLMLATDF